MVGQVGLGRRSGARLGKVGVVAGLDQVGVEVGFGGDVAAPVGRGQFIHVSQEFYSRIITGLGCHTCSLAVIATTTAHPSLPLVCQQLRMECHVSLDRTTSHSQNHGMRIMRETLYRAAYKEEAAKLGPDAKRVLVHELHFVEVAAPDEQPVRFQEVQPLAEKSQWRAGIDCPPSSDDLENAVPALMVSEMQEHKLDVIATSTDSVRPGSGTTRRIITMRGLKEGDTICKISCVLFSTIDGVVEFMNRGGNAALLDGFLLQVVNIKRSEDWLEPMKLYAAPTGIARYLTHYRPAREFPNVQIVAKTGCGPNDGFLEVQVHTHNGCGITAGNALVANLGDSPRQSMSVESTPSKRFRGALDVFFASQFQRQQEASITALAKEAGVEQLAAQPNPTWGPAHPHMGACPPPQGPSPPPQGGLPTPTGGLSTPAEGAKATGNAEPWVIPSDWGSAKVTQNGVVLLPQTLASTNKKVPPKTVLLSFKAGRVDEVQGSVPAAERFSWSVTNVQKFEVVYSRHMRNPLTGK